ncbi:MAG: rhodanese-like domain-containing protein [Rhodospirillaceae bacterium]|nr:rhodanese-like domain-containing protein [Rhodospirillaceae bacterium]
MGAEDQRHGAPIVRSSNKGVPNGGRAADGNKATFAGDLAPKQAWDLLASDPRAVLVDVRSRPEWQFVGLPDLSRLGKTPVLVSWHIYPNMTENPGFDGDLRGKGVELDMPVMFLCRSGGRSRAAAMAMAAMGFERCYNIAEGFEGPLDAQGRRREAGWKVAGLPWTQE